MASPNSMDLRERAMGRVQAGGSVRVVALSLSPSSVVKWSSSSGRWEGLSGRRDAAVRWRRFGQSCGDPPSKTPRHSVAVSMFLLLWQRRTPKTRRLACYTA
jgi:hypothetical protein